MSQGKQGESGSNTSSKHSSSSSSSSSCSYDDAMDALSSLITKKNRSHVYVVDNRFDRMFHYLQILELKEPISQMKIIHVAGTKGKGSTCVFTEAILRNCGFRTGLFTSPHLIDVRERFRLDAEKVDVAIIEVGLGGKIDATNVVQTPIVCGITPLGYDHTEILGNTLEAIAGQKAGIFKKDVPAFTVSQPPEAMQVLEDKASQLDVPLQVAKQLDGNLLNGLHLGLAGEHQYVNAGLAIMLSSTWLQRTGHLEFDSMGQTSSLPEPFIRGLTTANLQGRAQIIPDQVSDIQSPGDLVFYLDGAHSPESMEVCADWFSLAVKEDQKLHNSRASHELRHNSTSNNSKKHSTQILLFNCMSVRDPQLLFPRLLDTCANHGINFKKALFVPNMSLYTKVGSSSLPPTDSQVDRSWQLTLQRAWENIICRTRGNPKNDDLVSNEDRDHEEMSAISCKNSMVFSSLPLAMKWLRDTVKQNEYVRLQVLVTGSLHLVGDVIKLVKK